MTYKEQLTDPRWQKKRLQILERDKWTCQICLDTEDQLQVHHKNYDKTYKTLAWEYPDHNYQTLCNICHKALTDHISNFGNSDRFDVMKVKTGNGKKIAYIYTNGLLLFKTPNPNCLISEDTTKKIVQFLINNWLKNG